MDYPIHMKNDAAGGYAVARSEAEHKALSEQGYEPKYVAPVKAPKAPKE